MNTKFTPMHLTLFIETYTGTPSSYPDTPIRTEYRKDLIKQGLIYLDSEPIVTAYGCRKLEELLITMELPGNKT